MSTAQPSIAQQGVVERGHTIPVLDHGYVKLIDWMGTDESIVEAARMSTGKGFEGWETWRCSACGWSGAVQRLHANDGIPCLSPAWETLPKDSRLLEYLYKNKHLTPFEMCELAVEVQAPIMIFREWHRHRTQAYSELSARYAQMPDLHYVPSPERMHAAKQAAGNKQGSAEGLDDVLAEDARQSFAGEQAAVYANYERLIAGGVAKEVARVNTPVSRYSRMRAKTDLRNWLGFLLLRLAPNAQWEIRQYAEAVASIVQSLWPRTYVLFEEHDRHGTHLSRTEREQLTEILRHVAVGPEAAALIQKVRP